MRKYRADYLPKIELIEIVKESDKQIVYKNGNGREIRESKVSNYHSWHDTLEDAMNYLVGVEEKSIELLKSRISMHERKIKKIEQLTILNDKI